ncbi:hypothetical protein WI70_36365 [Burkholderia cepacia]|nr:hypothetical protein WI47_33465 [Burkholderia cepacia]KVC29552.1 hypothetical protein WI70_36365 [Burkholderia cepacia]
MDFLETLFEFSNFKLLGDTLRIDFKKRITLVFGTNGSGKSSLCEALRVLASPDAPLRPLQNVRKAISVPTSFKFKFRSDASAGSWSTVSGYGIKRATIKHFDTAVATRNITVAVDPGRIIELAPFKLNVFESATALTTRFRQSLQQRQRENATELAASLESLRSSFATFAGSALATISEKSLSALAEAIDLGENFSLASELAIKRAAAADMEKASSEDGLKLLKSEERELSALLDSVDMLVANAKKIEHLDPVNKAKLVATKQEAQNILAQALVPAGATLDAVMALAKAAEPLCSLKDSSGQPCPLCRRELGEAETQIFKQYANLLDSELEREIQALKTDIATATELSTNVSKVVVADWNKNVTVPTEFLKEAIRLGAEIVDGCGVTEGVKPTASAALGLAADLSARGRELLSGKTSAIDSATKGREQTLRNLEALRKEIEPLAYGEAMKNSLSDIKTANRFVTRAALFSQGLSGFQGILTKLTNCSKKAHEALVVADFEARLDREYKCLTERDMNAFGVTLARKGADATVTVLPQIGGKDIEGVLSEGEQRIHALALFFAELETCSQSVVAFDDPISSFDYNYITNYCMRLRDFSKDHPTSQIIVLTHNWEFFVHLQNTLNKAHLTNDLAVLVLDNCVAVAEYSEDVNVLKSEIDAVLALPGEPTKTQKEALAGNMRVLVEAVVNTHVFAKQRHQYKQKSQPVSNFSDYTKLTPLLPEEATELRDLYEKLSTPEHYDPRNSYVNTDKAMFQARYDRIIAIEAAIVARK